MRSRIPTLVAGAAVVAGALTVAVHRRRRARRRQVASEQLEAAELDARHAAKVARIVAQLRAHPPGRPVSIAKAAPPHQVPKGGDRRRHDAKIDTRALTTILDIDPERRVCVAEAGVMFSDLVAATLRHGLVPAIVPELASITIGGAVAGGSLESMSFKYGGFHDTCLEYEVVTARGDVLTCTPENQHALVFQMMHGAFGTLGILTRLTFRLVPAKPFVHVTYETYPTLAAYLSAIAGHVARGDADFLDGIIHTPTELVLAVARFTDRAPYTHRYDWMRIYYRSTRTRREDYLRTPAYLFRYDRGITSVHPRSFVGRLLFGRLLTSGTVLRAAEALHGLIDDAHPTVTLDVFLPASKVPAFLTWYERAIGHFPLWCVPYKRVRDYEWLDARIYAQMGDDDLLIDLAIYGLRQRGDTNVHPLIEAKLRELGGVKTLIAPNYYTRDEFWQTWNKPNYDRVKALTDPDNVFRDLYTKTCRTAMGVDDDRG